MYILVVYLHEKQKVHPRNRGILQEQGVLVTKGLISLMMVYSRNTGSTLGTEVPFY
jgi:hypothetical protein